MLTVLGIFILMLFGMVLLRHLFKRGVARDLERRDRLTRGELCPCGYPLTNLDMGRCPECGRVLHFDVNADDLGLTPDQLARIVEKRRSRSEQK